MSDAPPETDVPELPDVPAFVELLNRHGVRYVIIGGSAAQFAVPGLVTYDVDFSPSTDPDNLGRLSAALRSWEHGSELSEFQKAFRFPTTVSRWDGSTSGTSSAPLALSTPRSNHPVAATSTWPYELMSSP